MASVFQGDKKFLRALENESKGAGNKALRKAVRTEAKALKEDALPLVPVKTGKLRKAIRVRSAKLRNAIGMEVNWDAKIVPYGGFIHYGFKHKGGKVVVKKDFLLEAGDQRKHEFASNIISEFMNHLRNRHA